MRVRRVVQVLALVGVAAALSGCYVVPLQAPDGTVLYEHYPLPPPGTPIAPPATAPTAATLNVRL